MIQWILSSSVLICAVMLLRRLLKGRVNPRLQYALWGIVLIRLILPMSFFSSGLSVQNVGQEVLQRPEVQQMYDAMNEPIRSDREPAQVPQLPETNIETPAIPPQQQTPSSPGQQSGTAPAVSPEMPAPSLGELLLRIWLGGMAVFAAWMIGCNAHFAAGLRRSRRPVEIPASPLEVYITEAVETPCLFGVFRPAVYLTPEAVEDDRVGRYVLTHELTHYSQFDHVWSVLRAVCLVLHWYNPLVWLAFRASRQDGEMACDEGTLMQLGEEHRADYGRTLVALATRTRLRVTMITATTMADGKKAIRERIVILMKNPKTALLTMICLVLCCALIVGCTFTGAVEDPEETIPTETTQPEETTESSESSGYAPTPDVSEDGQDLPIPDGIPETEEEYDIYMEQCGFERFVDIGSEGYLYTGEKPTVFLEEIGLTLTIPDEWNDQVEIIYSGGVMRNGYSLYVVNRHLAEEYHGQLTRMAHVFQIWATRKTASYVGNPRTSTDGRIYLGENNEFYFYGNTAEMTDGMDTPMFWKYFIVREKGQAYYDDLIGDLILDPERIPGLVSIQDTPDAFVEEKPPQVHETYPDFTWTGHWYIYRYTGKTGVISFPEYGFTIHLPESWMDRVDVILDTHSFSGFRVYLMNRDVVQMYFEENILNPYMEPVQTDYILMIDTAEYHCTEYRWILDTTEEYILWAESREMALESPHYGMPRGKARALEILGEAGYQKLLGDLMVTDENIDQLITLHSGEPVTLCLTRDQIERYYGSEKVSMLYYTVKLGEYNVNPELINAFPNLKRLYVDGEFNAVTSGELALDFSELNISPEHICVVDHHW